MVRPAHSPPTAYPRADLVAAFLNGVPTVNVLSATLFEAQRLNTAVGPTVPGTQSPLGAATCSMPLSTTLTVRR